MSFDEFYQKLGFEKYPFAVFTSEGEADVFEDIYLPPMNHSVIREGIKDSSAIIIGERGTGKTALSLNLGIELNKKNNLIVRIEEFSALKENYEIESLYRFLIEKIVTQFFEKQIDQPIKLWHLSKEDRLDLSMYLHNYLGAASKEILKDKINQIQNGKLKRFAIGSYNFFRQPLNYLLKAFTKVISDSISSHFPALPPVNTDNSEYLRRIESEVDTSFTQDQKEFFYLEKICKLIKRTGIDKIYIFIDKVDEDSRFENDAENIADYIKVLGSDNKILTNSSFHILLFIWSTPFNYIKEYVRTQKISFYPLSWDKNQLTQVLDRRLSTYSNSKINKSNDLFNTDVNLNLLFDMCNRNPRDLWHIMNKAFEEQYRIDETANRICSEALSNAIKRFVTEFNYYEYYPKKSNARTNSMDVYKYIKHLTKLDNIQFTKDKLNVLAGTGSSTSNYVIAMENMGLIKNTHEKGHGGGVIYEIADPKIVHAMQQNLPIGS